MADELSGTIGFVLSGAIGTRSPFNLLPRELLELRHVAVSGDGEPTLGPQFAEAIESVVHVRTKIAGGFFKIVVISNGTGFGQPSVQKGIALLTNHDEVWAKLEAGTQPYMDNINRSQIPLEKVVENIGLMARLRPVMNPACGHLPLQALSAIARTVRRVSGLRAEIF